MNIPPIRWRSPLATIFPVYYACKLFGILPISYANSRTIPYKNTVHFIGRKHENVPDGCFGVSKSGLVLWMAQLTLQTWTFVRMCFYLGKTLAQRQGLDCSKDNYCSVFGMLLTHSIISPIVVSLVLVRLPRSVQVLNMTGRMLLRCRYPRRWWLSPSAYAVLVFSLLIVFKLVHTVVNIPQKYPDLYYPYFTAYMVPVLFINLVGVLCVVTQHSYEDINRELEELCYVSSKTERLIRLNALMNDHWFLDDFMETMSNTFGTELVFTIMDIYVQLLLLVYVIIWDTVVRRVFDDNATLFVYISGIIEFVIIVGKFVYLCYRCDSSVKEGKRIIFHLKHLSSKLSNDMNSQTLRLFTLRVNSRSIQVTASGFFDINLSLLFATAGVVLIYFLVLVQFQIEGHKQMLESNASNVTVEVACDSWPCLERF
ncbi:putative gustatory receptor 28a isoform X2 [Sipha flava]|uniref:Gustatory receptor n=1 Tax=Sipha flava TaxID=143950 RepID=A0A8B8G2A0_9HEMI|nr:putative gustatory receptor 28a isoform X2 [Sipha flava]